LGWADLQNYSPRIFTRLFKIYQIFWLIVYCLRRFLTCSILQAFLAPNKTIHALLIRICMLILVPKLFYLTLHYYINCHNHSNNLMPVIHVAVTSNDWMSFQYLTFSTSIHDCTVVILNTVIFNIFKLCFPHIWSTFTLIYYYNSCCSY